MVQRDGELAHRGEAFGLNQVPVRRLECLPQLAVPPHALEHVGEELEQRLVLRQVVVRAAAEGAGGERLIAVGRHRMTEGGLGRARMASSTSSPLASGS